MYLCGSPLKKNVSMAVTIDFGWIGAGKIIPR